jgi:adenylate kinase family enzyme
LTQDIKKFNDQCAALIPFLRQTTNFREINGEQIKPNVLKDVFSIVEPTVIHVRNGAQGSDELRKSIIKELTSERWGYANLDVQDLIVEEQKRKTEIGLEFQKYMQNHKPIPAEVIVRLLKRIIYSGDGRKKFILSGFPIIPEIIEQIKEFENNCATLSAVIYPANETSAEKPTIEIKNNNLGLFDIEAHFQKINKLKTMSKWDDQKWAELVGGSKIDWSIVLGMPFQGRTTLANIISKHLGFKLIDWKAVEEQVKK